MRFAFVGCVAVLAALASAQAANWVHIRDNGRGQPMCLDKDSIKLMPDGLTHYATRMCQDTGEQFFAVDCTQNFARNFELRIYDIGSAERYRETVVDDGDSGVAQDARLVCNK